MRSAMALLLLGKSNITVTPAQAGVQSGFVVSRRDAETQRCRRGLSPDARISAPDRQAVSGSHFQVSRLGSVQSPPRTLCASASLREIQSSCALTDSTMKLR